MPHTADWKKLSFSSILLIGLCLPAASEQTAFAATSKSKAAATSEDEKQCLPHCRSNFVCIKGECVSECNPPCSDSESCKEGECVAKHHRHTSSGDEQRTAAAPEQEAKPTNDDRRSRTEPSMPPGAKVNSRKHDGFYLRMSFGFGALLGTWSPASSSTDNLVGLTEHYELALGGTPIPGLVIGGGLFGVIAGSPMYGFTTRGVNINIAGGSIYSEIIGPFVDVYPKPSRGFHFMAALGPAGISESSGGTERLCYRNPPGCESVSTPSTPYSGVGVGFVAGVGYEAFVADHWSIGGIVRIMYTYGNLSPNNRSEPDAALSSFTPGLMFGATFQ